ncbi:hypothetical protein L798_02427 [Zootermopsis nevadensis]|uniref:Uncharacterized protein n=1 Tax=Zootermopsis nevadensis TaxID=136037 RepID=A0A067QHG0_ZOONE|nr:hypothetical protein L798_02427 [Zootermopsis nevadensis]
MRTSNHNLQVHAEMNNIHDSSSEILDILLKCQVLKPVLKQIFSSHLACRNQKGQS